MKSLPEIQRDNAPQTLSISDALLLPLEGKQGSPGAITQKYSFLGRTGSGKTYAATKLAELMLEAGAQVVALDPVGVWPFLRIGPKPFSLPVLGGLYGDVPLESTGGAAVADFIVDTGSSAVIDVSQFTSSEQARFATAFVERFFQRKKAAPSAVHLFIEECQEFVPQNASGGEAHMLHQFERLVKLGRNFGIGVSLISQRPQEVNKKALNQTECLFAFQMTGPQERKAIAGWAADKGLDVDLVEALPKLAVGHAHVWSPQWLGVSKEIRISKKRTADGSATPQVGTVASGWKLSPVDLPALRATMAETVERAKADDPKALRARIRELEKALAEEPTVVEQAVVERVEVPVFDEAAFERMVQGFAPHYEAFGKAVDGIVEQLRSRAYAWSVGVTEVADAYRARASSVAILPTSAQPVARSAPKPARVLGKGVDELFPARAPVVHRDPKPANGAAKLGTGERVILTAIAQHPNGVTREQLTVLTGYKRSSRDTYLQRLRAAALCDQHGERILATKTGRAELGHEFRPLPTGRALLEHWLGKLPEGERRVMEVVAKAHPRAVDRSVIDERTGYKRSSRDTYLQRLGARELVKSEGRGAVRMSEELV